MKTGLRIFIPFLIALLLDGLTKAWAEQALSSPIPILGNFSRLTLGYNTGVAFAFCERRDIPADRHRRHHFVRQHARLCDSVR